MGIGDSGDEFSEQAFRAMVDMLRDASRWARGSHGQSKHRMKSAWKAAQGKVRDLVLGEGEDPRAQPGDVVLWACGKDEIGKIKDVCTDMEIECKPGKRRSSGLTPILLPANAKLGGIDAGDMFNPLDRSDERIVSLEEEFNHEAATERLAAMAAAEAMKEEADALFKNIEFAPNGEWNSQLTFTTLPFDREATFLGQCLEKAGVGYRIAERAEEHVVIEFDARQTPLVETMVEGLAEKTDMMEMNWSRFPDWKRDMRMAKISMSQWLRQERGAQVVNLTVPRHRDAELFSSAMNRVGVASTIVGEESESKRKIIAVDAADLMAHDADIEAFMDGELIEQHVIDVLEGRKVLPGLPAPDSPPVTTGPASLTRAEKIEVPAARRERSRFALKRKATPETDERRARDVARKVNNPQKRTIERSKTVETSPRTSRSGR